MERTDSQGFTDPSSLNNTVIGSSQTYGSSGGPWLVNFGAGPKLPAGMPHGQAAVRNVVVGVTSNGPADDAVKQDLSSPFTSDNIEVLLHGVDGDGSGACNITPSAC